MKDTKLERTERIICNDLTRGKETNPIQTVNDLDEATEPLDYVYVKHNVTTTSVPVDRNISTLQVSLGILSIFLPTYLSYGKLIYYSIANVLIIVPLKKPATVPTSASNLGTTFKAA